MSAQLNFRPYDPSQLLLLPPDLHEWLPEDHLVHFVSDLVDQLDISAIYRSYEGRRGGQLPYHPRMMVKLLFYSYCLGIPSSRKIELRTYESVDFRLLTADQHPDHDTIASFRQQHLKALSGLFVQVLRLCQQAGLVKFGHVALDGTKVRANASKHKAMSYDRMQKKEEELAAAVEELLKQAQEADDDEDQLHGKGKSGDKLPEELRFKQSRLKRIREAKAALEAQAKAAAEEQRKQAAQNQQEAQEQGKPYRGKKADEISDQPDPKAQRNFTDPESRIMKDGATKSFEQCYNCQAVVDDHSQIIVASSVVQDTNDKQQVEPVVEHLKANMDGQRPKRLSADTGYFSESNVEYLNGQAIDPFVAVGRTKHSEQLEPAGRGRIPNGATVKQRMARKLRTLRGRSTYAKRKQIVEPVFGQIKGVRGFRQFLLRGLEKVRGEWDLICITHNVLKLFRSGHQFATA